MSVRIFIGHECGSDHEQAVLFCSGSDTVFGPFFESAEEASLFLEWLSPRDARLVPTDELDTERYRFLRERENGWMSKTEKREVEEREQERIEILADKKAGLL